MNRGWVDSDGNSAYTLKELKKKGNVVMLCKTFVIGCVIAMLGIVLSFFVLAFAEKRNSLALTIVGVICVLLTCFGTLGVGMIQRHETNRVSNYAYAWQRELYSDIAHCKTKEDTKPVIDRDLKQYKEGYQKLHIDNDRVAPLHRRPDPRVHIESGKWKKGEVVEVYIDYNDEAKSVMQKVVLK